MGSKEPKKEFHKEFYERCLRIRFNSKADPVSRKDLVNGLRTIVDLEDIERVTPHKNRFTWLFQMVHGYDINELLNKKITINDQEVEIEEPFDTHHMFCFKVSWAPPNFDIRQIHEHLRQYEGEVVKIIELRDEDGIRNGIYNISVKYPIEQSHHIVKLSGVQKIMGERILISRYGEQKRCNFCHQPGHIKRDCAKFKTICPYCNKRGHTVCSWRDKVTNNLNPNNNNNNVNNEVNDEEDDLEDAEDHLDSLNQQQYESSNINNERIYDTTQIQSTEQQPIASMYTNLFPTIRQGLSQNPKPKPARVTSTPLIDKSTAMKRGNTNENNSIEGNDPKSNKIDENENENKSNSRLSYSSESNEGTKEPDNPITNQ